MKNKIDSFETKCGFCGTICTRTSKNVKESKYGKHFCSAACIPKYFIRKERINLPCGSCGKECTKTQYELKQSKSGKLFCDRSCSASFNNKNKITGTRISKIEKYIADEIVKFYSFEFHFNKKDTIGSELDIFIPSLKLAFELNGIFHYKPIYGIKKFEQIQLNDKNKIEACQVQQIILHIIDVSKLTRFTIKKGEKYLFLVKEEIDKHLGNLASCGSSQA